MAKFLFFIALLLSAVRLAGQVEKIDTDRPDQTESVVTVPKGFFQAEFGFNKENLSQRDYDVIYPTALLKYGLKRFEFRLEINYKNSYVHQIPNPKITRGFDPVIIGFKAELWEEKSLIPKTSLIGSLGLPTIASRSFRADHLAPSFRFTMQHSLAKNIGLGYNIGAEWDGFSKTPAWIYTIAPGMNLGEKWYAYIEAFGFISKNEKPQHNLDGGIAYYINNNLKIDVSAGFGISADAPKNYMAVGFSFRCHAHRK